MKKYIHIIGIIANSLISIIGFSQNISINTTGAANSSNSMLEVLQPAGAATGTIGLYINHPGTAGTIYGLQSIVNGTATTHYAGYFQATNAANNYAIIVPSGGGSVGIGTNTPAYLLEADGDIYANGGWFRVSGTNGIYWQSYGPGWYCSDGTWLRTYNNASIWANSGTIATNGSFSGGYGGTAGPAGGAIFAGNVGIGTSTPAYNLDLNGGTFGFGPNDIRTEYRTNAGQQGAGVQSGFFNNDGSTCTNYPAGASGWWHLIDCRHVNPGNDYAMQFAGSFFDQNLYFRKTNNNPAQAWSQIYTSANGGLVTCGSNNYVVKSNGTNGICSIIYDNGTNVGIGTAGPRTTLDINGALDVGTFGGLTSTPTSYGTIGTSLAENGYYGILLGQTTSNPNFMADGSGNVGIYYQNWNWLWYSTVSNHYIGFGLTNPQTEIDVAGNISMNNRLALSDAGDGWLRLNQNSSYGNGTYTPGFLRCDGGLTSGAIGGEGAGSINFSGILYANSNSGSSGQALISQGGAPPVWAWATQGQQFKTVYSTASITLANGSPYTLVPGLTQTITIPATGTYDMYVYTDGGGQLQDAFNYNVSEQAEISIWLDGVADRYITFVIDNTGNYVSGIREWATSYYWTGLSAGNHTVSIYARNIGVKGKSIMFAQPNVVGNYLIGTLSVGLIKH